MVGTTASVPTPSPLTASQIVPGSVPLTTTQVAPSEKASRGPSTSRFSVVSGRHTPCTRLVE